MYAQKEKPAENKSSAVAHSVAQKKNGGKQGFGFMDNRPEAAAQRKLQDLGEHNSYAVQSKMFSKLINKSQRKTKENSVRDIINPIQLKTEVIHNSGIQSYLDKDKNIKGQVVGKSMFAYLDPYDPLTGTEADTFERTGIYTDPTYSYKDNEEHKYAKGPTAMHLLNAHLGGLATNENLFPQRSSMNRDHLNVAEYNAKAKLLTLRGYTQEDLDGARVYYGVEVQPAAKILNPENIKDSGFYVYGPTYVDKSNNAIGEDWETIVKGDLNASLHDKGWSTSESSEVLRGNREDLNSPEYRGNRLHFTENVVHADERDGDYSRRTRHHDSRSQNGVDLQEDDF
jgi:hypothetical protein